MVLSNPKHADSIRVCQLFEEYEARLVHYAWTILGDLESARDVTQDTFIKLCRMHEGISQGAEPAWLYRVCRNRALDIYRQRKRHGHEVLSGFEQALVSPDNVVQQTMHEERSREMLQVLERLDEKEQEVVRLKFLHELSYKDIAEVTGLSSGNVGYILHHALKKMRDWMQKEERRTPGPAPATSEVTNNEK